MNHPTTIYGEPVIEGRIFVALHKHLYGFNIIIRSLLRMNHPTVVWGRLDFTALWHKPLYEISHYCPNKINLTYVWYSGSGNYINFTQINNTGTLAFKNHCLY